MRRSTADSRVTLPLLSEYRVDELLICVQRHSVGRYLSTDERGLAPFPKIPLVEGATSAHNSAPPRGSVVANQELFGFVETSHAEADATQGPEGSRADNLGSWEVHQTADIESETPPTTPVTTPVSSPLRPSPARSIKPSPLVPKNYVGGALFGWHSPDDDAENRKPQLQPTSEYSKLQEKTDDVTPRAALTWL